MKIKNIKFIGIILILVFSMGILMSIPSVSAKAKNEHIEQSGVSERVFTTADEANLAIVNYSPLKAGSFSF